MIQVQHHGGDQEIVPDRVGTSRLEVLLEATRVPQARQLVHCRDPTQLLDPPLHLSVLILERSDLLECAFEFFL
jgi:hypothetical protein